MTILNLSTDYAIRCMIYMAKNTKYISSKEIAQAMSIPSGYVLQVLRKLKQCGLIEPQLGVHGGYKIIMNLKDISLLDIIEGMEDHIYLNRCMKPDKFCNRSASDYCEIHKLYLSIQDHLLCQFKSVTLYMIVNNLVEEHSLMWSNKYNDVELSG